ncbi:hypothetical protein Taro_039172 [Colocasia esculenta]|uniref:Uncharacterized protein n=1 Tax=Colocasia esculenta TaxID=4460 RepID=A0A843WLE3_COLES|nr:hypothetical protein [Colocasia esculenta]
MTSRANANRPGLAWFGFGNAAARPVAFMTRPEGRPRHTRYRGASRRRDNRGGPGWSGVNSRREGIY